MDFQYTATEMCSSLTLHPHNTNTLQDKENGGPCWNTVFDHYKDTQSPERWFIVRPSERGSIMPGPNAIPITGSTYVQWDDNNTSACVPFETSWIYQPSNLPALFADTWVENGSTLYEGQTVTNTTNTAGIITILGAHNGDTIRVSKSCGWMCSISGSVTASCSAMGEGQEQTGAAPLAPIVLQKDPFSIEVSSQPLGDGSSLKVMLQGSTVFPQTPHLEIWQDGAAEPIPITLAFDGVLYNGTANLDPTLKLGGTIKAQATDTQGYTVYRLVPFNIEIVNEEGLTWVQSSDGRMEVFLPAGSLSGNPAIGIQPNVQVNFEQDKLKVIGNPYQVTSSTGDIALELPGIVNIYYSGEDIYGGSLGLYQWDTTNQNWILISTNVDEENHFVSGQITELGTYAVLQLPLY